METPTRRQVILVMAALLVAAAVAYSFLPEPVPVQTAEVAYGPLRVVIEEEGETRVEDRYVISSPVAAFIRRVDLDVGDRVQRGQPLVFLEAPRSSILDLRTRDEARARVDAAEAALDQAREQERAARADAELAAADLKRFRALFQSGAVSRQELDQAEAQAAGADAAHKAASARVETARAELAAARAMLSDISDSGGGQRIEEVMVSPVAGLILAVHRRSEGLVNPGEPLLDVGSLEGLEVWTDVLSEDAVRIRPGTRVEFERWGGDTALEGVVRSVEPRATTEVSALGVEEQRVQVVAEIISSPGQWDRLGTGYRVLSRFVVWEGERVLQVPSGALFRTQDGWAAFAVEEGRASLRSVTVGVRSGLKTQVLDGLEEGQAVIVHPEASIEEGVLVSPQDG
jgi:HlyD family secretion protein